MAETAVPVSGGSGYNIDAYSLPDGKVQEAVAIGDGTTNGRVAHVGAGGDMYSTLTSPNAAALGIAAYLNPYGTLRVTNEPSCVFMDPFDGSVIDTARWTTGGDTPPTQATGQVTLAPAVGVNVNHSSTLISVPSFVSPGTGFLVYACTVTLESLAVPSVNVHRFWGKGQVTSYAYATPVTDGVGFEVEGTFGALQCVVYIAGTKYVINSTNSANISSSIAGMSGSGSALPSGASGSAYGSQLGWQAGQHRYAIMVRSDAIYWFVEGQEKPVAALSYASPNVQTLPWRVASITNSAATSLTHTFAVGATAVNDTTSGGLQVADGTYPWRKAKVDISGNQLVAVADLTATGGITTQNLNSTGVATAGSAVTLPLGEGQTTLVVQVTGAYTGALTVQGTVDGTTWVSLSSAQAVINMGSAVQSSTISSAAVGIWESGVGGLVSVRVSGLSAMTGTATVTLRATSGQGMVGLSAPLPGGTNAIGTVTTSATSATIATPVAPTAFTLNSAATTNATSVKASSAKVFQVTASNQSAAVKFLKIYNKASAPTVGTDIPVLVIALPVQAVGVSNVVSVNLGSLGMLLGTGFALAITGAVADSDTTAVALGDVKVMASYI